MFYLIGENTIRKMKYYNNDLKEDCFQSGLEMCLVAWKHFNSKKYNRSLPYITELFKRGCAKGFNKSYDKRMCYTLDSYVTNESI